MLGATFDLPPQAGQARLNQNNSNLIEAVWYNGYSRKEPKDLALRHDSATTKTTAFYRNFQFINMLLYIPSG